VVRCVLLELVVREEKNTRIQPFFLCKKVQIPICGFDLFKRRLYAADEMITVRVDDSCALLKHRPHLYSVIQRHPAVYTHESKTALTM
jgi:uncharacterized protein (DUF2225 family)